MARIAEAEIERLKREISVERLAQAKGVTLKAHGKDLMGLCPFHEDRTPSLVVTPSSNLWHCLGACQAGGSSIDWVMRAEGVSFRQAVELLRADSPSLAASFSGELHGRQQSPVPKKSTTVKLPALVERTMADEVLLRQIVGFYHSTLKESPEALLYMERRGLKNAELLEQFQIGFANRTLAYRLPSKDREAGAELRSRLQGLGILRESGHEHLTGSIVVPVVSEDGRVTEMYGRKITAGLRPGTPLHLYLPGPHRGVWNASALGASKEIILCESLIDAMTFWCAGFRNVTASYGVEGFTDDHLSMFRKHGTERVRIAYDRDEAGDRAAEKLASVLMAEGIECFRVQFPKGMDANEYALKMAPAAKALELVVRNAEWMGKGVRRTALPVEAKREATVTIVGETKTILADADGVVLAEIETPRAELPANASDNCPKDQPLLAALSDVSGAAPGEVRAADPATTDADVSLRLGDRTWRVRGLGKNTRLEALKVNLRVMRDGGGFHVDTVELYSARQRAAYVAQGAVELGVEERVLKSDLGAVLLKLEEIHEQKLLAPKAETTGPKLTEDDERAALALLRDPKLLSRIAEDFERCGVVGEQTNTLVGYLAATSRKLDRPLAVVIQSSSAAGKSSVMEAVLELMPEEERTQYSAMTGQSLFYLGETDLRHRILAIVEEEGASRASYALKLLQSEGELTIASTGKDPATGRLVTQAYRVEGPVMIFLTTTAMEVDEELLNRCLVLSVDEGRAQTKAIHARQRAAETLQGVLARRAKERVVKLHRDAQRLLRPLVVVNPFAESLSFLDHATRTRRDHTKYLTLIRTIALLHQYQREVKTVQEGTNILSYIEATREDIEVANRLCHEILGRSLDELPPQTRRLLGLVEELVRAGCAREGVGREDFRFTRRAVRESTRWGNTQLKVHLGRLVEMEYVVVHRGKQGQGYAYELAYDGSGKDGSPFVQGLLDASTTQTLRGSEVHFAGAGRGVVGPESGGGRSRESVTKAREKEAIAPRGDREVPLRAVAV
jgi:DNA primase catalytic core